MWRSCELLDVYCVLKLWVYLVRYTQNLEVDN